MNGSKFQRYFRDFFYCPFSFLCFSTLIPAIPFPNIIPRASRNSADESRLDRGRPGRTSPLSKRAGEGDKTRGHRSTAHRFRLFDPAGGGKIPNWQDFL